MNVLTVEQSDPFFLRDDQGQAVEVVPEASSAQPGSQGAPIALATGTVTLTPEQYAGSMLLFNGTLTGAVTVVLPMQVGRVWDCSFNSVDLAGFTITFITGTGAQPAAVPPTVNQGCRVGIDYPDFCCMFGLD